MSASCAMYAAGILRRSHRPRGTRPTTTKEVWSEVAICSVRLPVGILPARVNNDVPTRAGGRLASRTRVDKCGAGELLATTITSGTAGVLSYGRPAGNGDAPPR